MLIALIESEIYGAQNAKKISFLLESVDNFESYPAIIYAFVYHFASKNNIGLLESAYKELSTHLDLIAVTQINLNI